MARLEEPRTQDMNAIIYGAMHLKPIHENIGEEKEMHDTSFTVRHTKGEK